MRHFLPDSPAAPDPILGVKELVGVSKLVAQNR